MSRIARLDGAGALLHSGAPTLDLVAGCQVGVDGTLQLDALRPEAPYGFSLGPRTLTDPAALAFARAWVGEPGAGTAAWPAGWQRCAVVAAVDRWSRSPLDERVLAIDLAAAAARAGLDEPAREAYLVALPRLTALIDAELGRELPRPTALVDELQQVIRAGRSLVPEVGSLLGTLGRLVTHRGGRTVTADVVLDRVGPEPLILDERTPLVVVDPLRLPSRLLLTHPQVGAVGPDVWEVTADLSPGVTADDPRAARLTVAAFDTDRSRLVALGALQLDPRTGRFHARVATTGTTRESLVFGIQDALAPSLARYEAEDRQDVDLAQRAQAAFTMLRQAITAAALGDGVASSDALHTARLALGDVRTAGRAADDVAEVLDAAARFRDLAADTLFDPAGNYRPLLAELVAATSTRH